MGTVGQFSVIFLPALSRIIQTKFIAVAQLRKILSKNANLSSSLAPPLPLNHSAKHVALRFFLSVDELRLSLRCLQFYLSDKMTLFHDSTYYRIDNTIEIIVLFIHTREEIKRRNIKILRYSLHKLIAPTLLLRV